MTHAMETYTPQAVALETRRPHEHTAKINRVPLWEPCSHWASQRVLHSYFNMARSRNLDWRRRLGPKVADGEC